MQFFTRSKTSKSNFFSWSKTFKSNLWRTNVDNSPNQSRLVCEQNFTFVVQIFSKMGSPNILQLCARLARILVLFKKKIIWTNHPRNVFGKLPGLPRGSSSGQVLLQGCHYHSPGNAQITSVFHWYVTRTVRSKIFVHHFLLYWNVRVFQNIGTAHIYALKIFQTHLTWTWNIKN